MKVLGQTKISVQQDVGGAKAPPFLILSVRPPKCQTGHNLLEHAFKQIRPFSAHLFKPTRRSKTLKIQQLKQRVEATIKHKTPRGGPSTYMSVASGQPRGAPLTRFLSLCGKTLKNEQKEIISSVVCSCCCVKRENRERKKERERKREKDMRNMKKHGK